MRVSPGHVFPLLVALVLCGCSHPHSKLAGQWVLYGYGLEPRPVDWKINLHPDGTLTYHQETHVMMNVVLDGTGTYEQHGDRVVLKGTEKGFRDDGYAKEQLNTPFELRLVYKDDSLIPVENKAISLPAVFYRSGDPRDKVVSRLLSFVSDKA